MAAGETHCGSDDSLLGRNSPVLVSSSYFEDSELSRFQAVNSPSKPLDMASKGKQEAAFCEAAQGDPECTLIGYVY